jgi:hypothetical protein
MRRSATVCCCTLFAVGLAAGPCAGQDERPELLAAAEAAWQRRQDAVRSARFTFREDRTQHRAYYKLLQQESPEARLKLKGLPKLVAPPNDISTTVTTTVLFDPTRFRLSSEGTHWHTLDGRVVQNREWAITNGGKVYRWHHYPDTKRPPQGSVSSGKLSDEHTLALVPIMLCVRGVTDRSAMRNIKRYQSAGRQVPIDGRPCAEVTRRSLAENQTESLFLDTERDYVVRRIDSYTKGKLTFRLTIDYTPDPVAGWLPSTWSYVTRSSAGEPRYSGKGRMEAAGVNPPVSDADFEPEYPPGTLVLEEAKPRGTTARVVDPQGNPGVAVPLAPGVTYEQLTQANESAASNRPWVTTLLIAAGVMGAAAVAVWAYRRRSRTEA